MGGQRGTAIPAQVNTAVDTALDGWRRKATDVLMGVSAIVLLPVLALVLLGYGIPVSWGIKAPGVVAYLTILGAALARGVDYRVRVWVVIGASYLFTLVGSAAYPQAPFMRILPFEHAIFVLVLTGATSGRIATLISIGVFLLAPVLHVMPGFASHLVKHDPFTPIPLDQMLMQSINISAVLIGLMVLLDRFHAKLLDVLATQQRATDDLRRESAERAEALLMLEREAAERRRLERELSRIGDEERRRLGQDVHDGVCQQLTGALLRCQALERRLARGDQLPVTDIGALSTLLEEAIDEAHHVAQGLYPLEPRPGALAQALRTLAKQTQTTSGLRCRVTMAGETEVADPTLAQHLYRIAQEAVSNAVRHAGAGQINITLHMDADDIVLQVVDDGRGLPQVQQTGGLGMRTMAFRAQIMEGTLTIDPVPEGGTCVACRVPMHRAAAPTTADIIESVTSDAC